jgi:hypothetical protein
MSVVWNYSYRNSTTDDVLLDHTDKSNRPILDKQSDYDLSLIKFSLPASAIPSFKITDDSHSIQYGVNLNQTILGGTSYSSVVSTVPLYKHDEFPMYSIEDFVENYNRSSLKAYRNLLEKLAFDNFLTNVKPTTLSGTFSLTGSTAQQDLTFAMSGGLPNNMSVGYVKLDCSLYGTSTP